MTLTRRALIQKAGIAALASSFPQFLRADLFLGSAQLTTISDGYLSLPGSFLFAPMPQNELQGVLADFELSSEELKPECNIALYRDGTNTVLFDAGAGPDFMPTAGSLLENLSALDLGAEDITHVVFTHAHPDHIWGLLDDFDEPVFSGAQYLMGRTEWDYWWNPETVNTIGTARAAFAVGAKRRMEAIESEIVLFDDGDEVLPGIAAVASYGHTPGHMSFEIRNGAEAALIAGDAIGNHHVAFARPDWPGGSDQDPQKAIETRGILLDRAAQDDLALVGFHLPNGGIGWVERTGETYRFIQEG